LKLLREEINHHKKNLHELTPKHEKGLSEIRDKVKWYDFHVISSKLKELCKKEYNNTKARQDEKLRNLCRGKATYDTFDPTKIIYNFTDRTRTEPKVCS